MASEREVIEATKGTRRRSMSELVSGFLHGRSGRRVMRRGRWLSLGAVLLVLVACTSEPPSPEEVIPDGSCSEDGRWCVVLTDEDVSALVGEDQLERVREISHLKPGPTSSQQCMVAWADGEDFRTVVTLLKYSEDQRDGAELLYRAALPVLGEDARKLRDGRTDELGDGVYTSDEYVHSWTVMEPQDGGPPTVGELRLRFYRGQDGLPSGALDAIGERMQGAAPGLFDWDGESRPFMPEDLATLLDAAVEAGTMSGPWRGHAYGQ